MQIQSFHICVHSKTLTRDKDSNTVGLNICEFVQEINIIMELVLYPEIDNTTHC